MIAKYQPNRKKPFVARWYEGRRQRNRFFATAAARDEFIEQYGATTAHSDPTLPELAPHQLIRLQQATALAPDADPVEVFRFWKEHESKQRNQQNRRLSEASDAYLRNIRQLGQDNSHIRHKHHALMDLQAELGDPFIRDISAESIREYLLNLPFKPRTIKNKRIYLLAAFGWWVKQGWLDSNPIKLVEVPPVHQQEPGIFSVAETRALFRANEKIDPEICGLLALGAFGGMRTSAIARVDYAEIDFKQGGILTPAEKTKKKRRQWIEDLPDNLWAWLRKTPPTAFEMSHRQMLHRRAQAFKRAGLLVEADDIARENNKREARGEPLLQIRPKCPPKNALRHSFVTYHVALHRNPGKTALIISHRDQDCLYRHYLGIANQKDAGKYFEIKPRK